MKQRLRVPSNAPQEKRPPAVASLDETVEAATAGPSQPLDSSARSFLEPRFGHDFSSVRIHADSRAAQSADAVQAHAYATGKDIVFGQGRYQPGSADGKKLLAHELAHVVQQSAASPMVQRVVPPSTSLRYDGPDTLPPTVQLPDTAPAPPGQFDNRVVGTWNGFFWDTNLHTENRASRDFNTLGEANIFASSFSKGGAVFLENKRYVVYPLDFTAAHHFTYDNVKKSSDSNDCDVNALLPVESIVTEDGVPILPAQLMTSAGLEPDWYGSTLQAEDHAPTDDPFSDRKGVYGLGLGTITDKKTFLKEFRAGMRQVALTALDKSQNIAEAKQKEMGGGVLPSQDKSKILMVATQVATIDKELHEVRHWAQVNPRSLDVEGHRRAVEAKEAKLKELNEKRNLILVDYPLLAQVDAQDFIDAQSEPEQAGMLGDAAGDILKNIQKTRDNVLSDDINLWAVKPIVDATRTGLGIQDSGRIAWIDEKVANDKEDSEATSRAWSVFQIGLTVAGLAFGGPAGVALLAGGIGASALDAALITEKYYDVDKPAALTDIDKNKSLIPADLDARSAGLVMAWVSVGVQAALAVPWARLLQEGTLTADEVAVGLAKSTNISVETLRAAAGTAMQMSSGELVEMLASAAAEDASVAVKAEYAEKMVRGFAAANNNAGVLVEMSGGSWKSVTTTLRASKTAEANALLEQMNAWRIQQYDEVEAALGIKLVRTGTPSPLSDMDASVLGPNSNEMRAKADQLLTERFGTGWRDLMDADLFSDPTRMYLLQTVDYNAAREAIMLAEKRLVDEAELNLIAKMQVDEAPEDLINQYAKDMGIPIERVNLRADMLRSVGKDPKQIEAEIDSLHAAFVQEADPAKQAEIAESIARKQGLVNASQKGPYMTPGGVLKHVGMRDLAFRKLLDAGRSMSPAMGYMTVLDDLYMCEHVLQDIGKVGLDESNAKAMVKYAERLTITAGQYGVDFSKAEEARELFDQVSGLLSGMRGNPAEKVKTADKFFREVAGLSPGAVQDGASVLETAQASADKAFLSLRNQIPELRGPVKANANAYFGDMEPAKPSDGGGIAPGGGAPGAGGGAPAADAAEKQAAAEMVSKTEDALKKQEELLAMTPQVAGGAAEEITPTVASVEIDYAKGKLSSAGWRGSQVRQGFGVFEGRIPGVSEPVAVKIFPSGRRALFETEMENARAASATGRAAKFYGEVPAGEGKLAFAMEKVQGDFPDFVKGVLEGEPFIQAEREAASAASRVTFSAVADVYEFGKGMLDRGYYAMDDLQGLITEEGHWRAIDFGSYKKLPDPGVDMEAYNEAVAEHTNAIEKEADKMKELATQNLAKVVAQMAD